MTFCDLLGTKYLAFALRKAAVQGLNVVLLREALSSSLASLPQSPLRT